MVFGRIQILFSLIILLSPISLYIAYANPIQQTKGKFVDKFRQLEGEGWPSPNRERPATGAPGPEYWQQKVNNKIEVEFDEVNRTLKGKQTIVYKNNSPFSLKMLWLNLEKNKYSNKSMGRLSTTSSNKKLSYSQVRTALHYKNWDGSYQIKSIQDEEGNNLPYTIVDTLMRIDLDQPIKSGDTYTFSLVWKHNIRNVKIVGGRGGYECFNRVENKATSSGQNEKNDEGNCIYEIAQWYPRMVAFSDYEGWHNKTFLGSGEFTLEFGDFEVSMTVPSDFVIASTGILNNPEEVLTEKQRKRLDKARHADKPVFIITPEEALKNEKKHSSGKKTWVFKAKNVRDFAWAGSRKFIWDAMGVEQYHSIGKYPRVLAMSFYPNEAEPLWSEYSTRAVAHTIRTYSKFSIPYPYPVIQSVNGPIGGMEYPMITFNGGGRPVPDKDGNLTYSRAVKNGLISVIIHEVGHNYFPMTINSDERQWTWMDEGFNTFLQYLAEQEWEKKYPSRRGIPANIANYMQSSYQVPIMTNSESILQFGNNAYGKTATALSILRETILGRELFDKAFKTYTERWRFKRPIPSDFFRTMEEVSGVDLDWFWRGWFYSTDHVDIGIKNVVEGRLSTLDPDVEMKYLENRDKVYENHMTLERNQKSGIKTYAEKHSSVLDYYSKNNKYTPSEEDRKKYEATLKELESWQKKLLKRTERFYFITLENLGGLVMPIILKANYADGSNKIFRYPAEIWRYDPYEITKMIMTDKEVSSFELDPLFETADTYLGNNYFPQRILPSRIELYKRNSRGGRNLMRKNNLVITSGKGLKVSEKSKVQKENKKLEKQKGIKKDLKEHQDKKIFIWDLFKKKN